MKKGYYDLLLDLAAKIDGDYFVENLQQETKKIQNLDHYLIQQFNQKLNQHLSHFPSVEGKVKFLNQLLINFSDAQFSHKILKQVQRQNSVPYQSPIRLTENYLFTNQDEQNLVDQLNQEIMTSDKVFFIYPFISKTMINKLRNAFQFALTKQIEIKIITTTFDDQALFVNLFELEQLIKTYPNISIRIEDNTELRSERIHIKAAIFHRESGFSSVIIGSSNLTMPGMSAGREWNLRMTEFEDQLLYQKITAEFQKIWEDNLLDFNLDEVRQDLFSRIKMNQEISQIQFRNYSLYDFQKEILKTLNNRRQIGKKKHLLIMATGTGKTIVSAFDYFSQELKQDGKRPKILFLAHQKEIIEQGLKTFREVLKDAEFGEILNVGKKNFQHEFLFATIQSVHRHLKKFHPTQFDWIIFDEAHHIAANTFDEVFHYFHPDQIIGLTATPEREDNKSILPYFDDEFAFELRLWEAINQKLLAKFDYYCIDDTKSNLLGVDLNNEAQVFKVLNNNSRNELLFTMIKNYLGIYSQPLTLVFCINVEHAQIISDFLNQKGLKANFLTSKNNFARTQIIKDFQQKKINYLCVVNMFNEGIDVPEIDTIILLRPTNSKTIFLQQLGRGLRKTATKNKLGVYDLIANIDQKYDITLGIKNFCHNEANWNHQEIFTNGFSLPDGCTINLEPRSKEIILKNLKSWYQVPKRIHEVVREYYQNYGQKGMAKIIADYDLTLPLLYQYLDNFYFKVGRALNHDDWKTDQTQTNKTFRNKNILKQFLFLNNYHLVYYFYARLKNDWGKIKINSEFDNLLIVSLFPEVTSLKVYNTRFNQQSEDLISDFIQTHSLIVEELVMILDYKLKHETLLVNESEIPHYPLLIKGTTYSVRQALAAIKRLNFLPGKEELKVIAFQAGHLTFETNKTVVLADIDGGNYGKLTKYDALKEEFYWSIPETKSLNSKLVHDLQTQDITKFLFLDNKINKNYSRLSGLKLYDFVGLGSFQQIITGSYLTVKFQVES